MKLQKVTVAIAVVFGCGAMSSLALADTKHFSKTAEPEKGRAKSPEDKLKEDIYPKRYESLIEVGTEDGQFKYEKIECGKVSLKENDGMKKLKGHFQTILKYRKAVEGCNDSLHGELKKFLDEYVGSFNYLLTKGGTGESLDEVSGKAVPGSWRGITGVEKAFRFHEHLKNFLSEKKKALEKSKDKFEEADAAFEKALDGVKKWCVGPDFKPSDDEETTKKIDEFNNQVKKQGIKDENACELEFEAPPAPAPATGNAEQEAATAPPAGNGGNGAAASNDPSQGTGALPPGAQQNVLNNPPGISTGAVINPQGNAAFFDPALANNQLAQDQQERQQLIDTLRQAAQDATRPNQSRVGGSPDNSRAFSPQLPGVNVQPSPTQQQPQQQQQYPQMPFPQYPMQQPVAASPITPELLNALRNSDNNRQSPNAAAQAAQTQSLMEMAKLQQQLMQAQMANQSAMYNYNPYIRNASTGNMSRLRRTQTAFRGTRGTAGSRFMSQGRVGRR